MKFTFRDFIRVVRFCKWPVIWVVGCLVGFAWTVPHATSMPTTVEQAQWNSLQGLFIFGLMGFGIGFFSIAEAIHSIDRDERLRVLFEMDNIQPSAERRQV